MDAKVRRIGNSLGIIIPRDMLNILGISESDYIKLDLKGDAIQIVLRRK